MSETPLAKKLRLIIEANGPLTIAEYMAHCLGNPAHGYYTTHDPFGAAGDFVTAPEVSQMFGEIIGAWLAEMWRMAGSPMPVRLVELGPGRGTLMADILRVVAKVPKLRDATSVHLVETSPRLVAAQKEMLSRSGANIRWHTAFDDVPAGPLLLVANEFFDALPVRQFVRVDGRWRERVVGIDSDRLAFGIGAGSLQAERHAPENSILEVCPAAEALALQIAARISQDGTAALIVDYGYERPGFGDTLQAVQNHAYADPLAFPGESDLTAHVDFPAIAASAHAAGAAVHGPIAQGDFLLSLGLAERAARLGVDADAATRKKLQGAVERLADADQMGRLFKVMALTSQGLKPPPLASG